MAGRRARWIALVALVGIAATAWAASVAHRPSAPESSEPETAGGRAPTELPDASAPSCLAAAPASSSRALQRTDSPTSDVIAALRASVDRLRASERWREIPAQVDVIDGLTGANVPGACWRSRLIFTREADWLPSGTVGPCHRGRRPEVDLPEGWATFEEWWPAAFEPEGCVQGRARLLAFPEARVHLALTGTREPADGTRLEVLFAFVDGEPAEGVRDEVGVDGVHRVKSIPFLPNAALVLVLDRVRVLRAPLALSEVSCDSEEAEITILPDRALLVRATLPTTESEAIDLHVDVTALTLEDRPHGSSRPPSCIRLVSETEGDAGAEVDPWARIEVAVRDADGAPAPFSSLELETMGPVGYGDLDEEGMLQLDPYADALGRRVFHRVPPGEVRVVARYRGRRAESRFEARAGDRRVLVLTLPD